MSAPARFTVSGPFEEDRSVESVGQGCSIAQTFATRHRREEGDRCWYVRDADECTCAIVTKTAEVSREEASTPAVGQLMLA